VIDGRPEALRRNCEDSLRRLQTEVIDLMTCIAWDKSVPIEDSMGAMADLAQAGKVRAVGLSQVSAPRCAKRMRYTHRSCPDRVFAVDAQPGDRRSGRLPRAGRGLCGVQPGRARLLVQHAAGLARPWILKDIRRSMPRFEPANYAANLGLMPATWR